MPVLISGVLKDATGTPVQNCTIQLKACRTSTTVVVNTVASENPDDAGRYSMDVEQGQYTVTLLVEGYVLRRSSTEGRTASVISGSALRKQNRCWYESVICSSEKILVAAGVYFADGWCVYRR